MGQFSKLTDARGVVRYRDEESSKFVKGEDLPEQVKEILAENDDSTIVEWSDGVARLVEEKESDGPDDSQVESNVPDPAVEPVDDEPADGEGEFTDESDGIDYDETTPTPDNSGEEGMGFPMANGKTLSVFGNQPHETIRYVEGIVVPVTMEEYKTKTDAEIVDALRKLGKIK